MKIPFFSFELFPFLNTFLIHSRVSWSIRLRFMAVAGYFIATIIAKYGFHLILPYDKIWLLLAFLLFVNFIYLGISLLEKNFSFTAELVFLFIHIIIDLIVLTVLVHYSGGMENPIYLFYVFHIVISSIIFPRFIPVFLATFAIILFSILLYLEYSNIIDHYFLFGPGIHDNAVAIYLTLAIFIITIYVSTYICTSFMKINRTIKQEIDIKNQKLVEADQQKSQFFQFTSHELKSPLIAIKSSIDGIIKNYADKLDNRGLDILGRASSRSDQMLLILSELLELAKNRRLIISEDSGFININDIIKEVASNELIKTEEKNIVINLDLNENEILFRANLDDIKKVLINLIDNAIRYSKDNDRIDIITGIKNEYIIIKIKDTGIGIPEKDISKIFNEFYRAENAKNMIHFGTGLGLCIVKQIIENYQGSIRVESKLNQGTTFIIELPIHRKEYQ